MDDSLIERIEKNIGRDCETDQALLLEAKDSLILSAQILSIRQAKLDAAEQALAGEKARVDIAERRSIAAGEQAEELQAQIIDLNIYHRKATKELVERLQRSYEDGVIIGRHNDDLTAALKQAMEQGCARPLGFNQNRCGHCASCICAAADDAASK